MPKKIIVGWREWISLPDLGISHLKAKLDTGARTSVLHAVKLELFEYQGINRIHFHLPPHRQRCQPLKSCVAEVLEQRWIRDSGGHRELRYVIATPIHLGEMSWRIEITLTNRDTMKYPMLLGRTAMRGYLLVDSQRSYLLGKPLSTC
jgi:hypothetical protein